MKDNYSLNIRNTLKRKKIKIGDKIKINKKGKIRSGTLMPRIDAGDKGSLIIKDDSGYNIGVKYERGIKVEKISSAEKIKIKPIEKIVNDHSKPTISILHTGGTIASKVDYNTGGVISSVNPEEIIEMYPELRDIVNIKSRLVSNMWSEDMNFKHYNLIGKEVEKEIKSGVDGVIVTQGTDTMHYTSAALSFILENLGVPVLFVGSQRSSDRGSSDAFFNLLCAVNFIINSDFGEVGVCMHEGMSDEACSILPACKVRKMHTSRRDAFKAINSTSVARVSKDGIEFFKEDYIRKFKDKKLKLKLFKDKLKVGVLKAHPNLIAKEVEFYNNFNGLILEGYGIAGNFPINKTDKLNVGNQKIYNVIKKLAKKIPLVVTSQTIFGRINMNVYTTGREMKEIGILGNLSDMTTETAFIKLAWLLSNYPKSKVKELIGKNLRGEISSRSEVEEDYLKM